MPKVHVTFEFEDEAEMRAHFGGAPAPTPTETAPAPTETETAPAPTETAPAPTRSDTDADGMPYDEALHSDPPNFKADGTWRAKRGKSEEEKAARAAFKAAGGNVAAPALPGTETAAPTLPGTETAAPTLPASMPEPISFEKMVEKVTGMMTRGVIDNAGVTALYQKHGGDNPPQTLSVNETARAALFSDLCEIEPELS